MELKERLRAQLSEAEALVKDLEALQSLPDLLARHDGAAYRLFMLACQIGVPEKIANRRVFRPRMVESATILAEAIANQLRLKLQVQEVKETKGAGV